MSSNSNAGSGVSVGTVIFLILLILKLFGVINISWWWVFSPLLIGLGITIILAILFVLIIGSK
jgi:hypothetical protein